MAPPDRSPKRLVRIKLTDSNGFSKVVLIERDPFSIGSDPEAALSLPDGERHGVSPRHAVIVREGDDLVLTVESGVGATRVNGRPIRRMVLRHADQIALGDLPLRIQFLVEGTRAADQRPARERRLVEALRRLHEVADAEEAPACAVAAVMDLLAPSWVVVSLEQDGTLCVKTSGHASGSLPRLPSRAAQDTFASGRSYFKPDRICIMIPGARRPLGVVEVGSRDGAAYSAADLETLEGIVGHLGVAMTNARHLEETATLAANARAG